MRRGILRALGGLWQVSREGRGFPKGANTSKLGLLTNMVPAKNHPRLSGC